MKRHENTHICDNNYDGSQLTILKVSDGYWKIRRFGHMLPLILSYCPLCGVKLE